MTIGRNTLVAARGETRTIREWSERTGIRMDTLIYRVERGFTGERLLEPGHWKDASGVTRKQREALDCIRALTADLGRPPTFVQVAEQLGIDPKNVALRLQKVRGKFVQWQPFDRGTLTCI